MRFAGDIFTQGGLGPAGYGASPFRGGGLMGPLGGFNPGYSDNDSGWQHLAKMFLGPGLGGLVGKDFT